MKRPLLVLGLVVLSESTMIAGGDEIEVVLLNGTTTKGELLAVRERAIVLSLQPGATEQLLASNPGLISVISVDSILRITEEGHSRVLLGMGLGLVAGGVIGAVAPSGPSGSGADRVVGEIFEPIGRAMWFGIGALIGAGVGAIVGLAASSGDQELRVSSPGHLYLLRQHARYTSEEPPFINPLLQ